MGYQDEFGDLGVLADEIVARFSVATVVRVEGEQVLLTLGGDRFYGRRAFSCLVVPRAGDTVSVVSDGRGSHYVTAILERPEPGEIELYTEHPMTIQSAARVRVTAATGLDLEAGERIRLRSPVVEALVDRFAAVAKAVCVTTGDALLNSRAATLCSELVDVAAKRIGLRAEHSHRQIDGTEQLRCRHLDVRATELANVRARTTVMKAKDLVKIDAAQIQIG